MSKIINGDITKIPREGAIVQQVNCQGVMGAGVALAILKKWPHAQQAYKAFCKGKPADFLFGDMQATYLTEDLILYNSFTQLDYGTHKKQTDEYCLIRNIREIANRTPNTNVYIPYLIGCGLAGGDWNIVYEGIKDIDNLVIVKYDK